MSVERPVENLGIAGAEVGGESTSVGRLVGNVTVFAIPMTLPPAEWPPPFFAFVAESGPCSAQTSIQLHLLTMTLVPAGLRLLVTAQGHKDLLNNHAQVPSEPVSISNLTYQGLFEWSAWPCLRRKAVT
jgi:hypothetical protein